MKNFLKLLLVFGVISLASCGGDDCTADSFVGMFSGTVECPDEDPASGTLTITRVSETTIKVVDPDGSEFDMEVDGCTASATIDFFGVMVTQTLTLDGDKLDYRAESSAFGVSVECTGTMTRQ